jgi:hypothetical protein
LAQGNPLAKIRILLLQFSKTFPNSSVTRVVGGRTEQRWLGRRGLKSVSCGGQGWGLATNGEWREVLSGNLHKPRVSDMDPERFV